MKANYSSRGYQVYGDKDNVQKDANTIKEIIERQGFDLIIESLANYAAQNSVKFKLSEAENAAVLSSLTLSLKELFQERT